MDRYLKASLCHHPPSNTLRNIIFVSLPTQVSNFQLPTVSLPPSSSLKHNSFGPKS